LTSELTAWIWPPTTSSAITPISLPSGSSAIAPGWPFTSARRKLTLLKRAAPRVPGQECPCHAAAAVQRSGDRRHLAAAVAVQRNAGGQQRFEALQVALLGRREEAGGEPLAVLA